MSIKTIIKKALPTVMTVVSVAGVVATAALSSKAGIKAKELIEEAEASKHDKLTKFEKVQVSAPAYISTIAAGALTVACIVGVRTYDRRQQAALIGGYALIKRNYERYKNKVKELLGIEAHEKVMDAITVEDVNDVYISVPGCIGNDSTTEFGVEEPERLFYDEFSGRCFEATIGRVLQAEMHLNRNFSLGAEVTVNDFYDLLGLEHIENGNKIGWYMCDGIAWIDFNHKTVTMDDGLECCTIEMVFYPELEDEVS